MRHVSGCEGVVGDRSPLASRGSSWYAAPLGPPLAPLTSPRGAGARGRHRPPVAPDFAIRSRLARAREQSQPAGWQSLDPERYESRSLWQTRQVPSGQFFNIPNQITTSRLVLSVVVFVLIPLKLFWSAMIVFLIAASTDWIDGSGGGVTGR